MIRREAGSCVADPGTGPDSSAIRGCSALADRRARLAPPLQVLGRGAQTTEDLEEAHSERVQGDDDDPVHGLPLTVASLVDAHANEADTFCHSPSHDPHLT